MFRTSTAKFLIYQSLFLLGFFIHPLAFSRVNFIHTTNDLFYTMYVDEKNVYLQKCETQSTSDFDETCEKKYRAKSLSFKNYFNSIPLDTGSFSKEPNALAALEAAIEEARKLAEEGNQNAKEKLLALQGYKDKLIVIDAHRKELKNELTDKTELKFEFSNHYKEFLEPFSRIKDEVANFDADGIPDLNAEQFIEHFNKASKIAFDEIPDRTFIYGKQYKFVTNKLVKGEVQYLPTWVSNLEITKGATIFSDRNTSNGIQTVRYSHSIIDPFRMDEVPYHSMIVSVTEDSSGLSMFHDRALGRAVYDFGCPTKFHLRKIKFADNTITYLMIKSEIVRGNLEEHLNCPTTPLHSGFMGVLTKN